MRRLLLLGSPLVILLCGGLGWYVVIHRGNLLADAQARMALGDLHGAEIDLDSYVRQHPRNPIGEFRLGLVQLGLENPVAAARELRLAGDHGYDKRAIILPLGETYRRQHLYEQALEDFDPAHAPQGGLADTLALRAEIYLDLKQPEDAAAAATAAENAAPKDAAALIAGAQVALARDLPALATAKIARALAVDPANAKALLLKGDLALHNGDAPSALAITQAVLRINPADTAAKMEEARAYAAMNDAANAVPLLDQVARADRNSSAPRFLRAILADRAHDFATADIQLAGLSNIIDDLPQGYYYLGVTKLGLGQVDQAEDAAAKYHARSPNDQAGTKLLALAELAINQPITAVGLVSGLVQAGHADAETLDLLGRAQAATNDWAHAADSLARAHAQAPDNVEILNRLAVAEFQTGRDREAVSDLQRSLDLQPGQDQAGSTLVRAALAAGDLGAARDAVLRLQRAHGETPVTGMLNADILAATLDLRGAETGYRAVLQRYAETADDAAAIRQTTLGLVRVLGMEGDSLGVQTTLADWVHLHPKDEDVLGMLSKLLFAAGKPDQAVQITEAAHDTAPGDARLTEMLARAHVAAHQLEPAETLLDRAGAATNPKLARLRAEILVMDGKRDQARAAYADLLQTAPGDSIARAELMQLLAQANSFDQARSLGQDGLSLHPGDPLAMQALVGVAMKQGGLKAALAEAATLNTDAQNMPAAALLPAAAYAAAGDTEKAADAALVAYREVPSGGLLAPTWTALVRAGRQAEAEALATGYASAHPDDVAPDQLLGASAAAQHHPAEAVRYLQIVLRQRPNDASTLNNLACALLAQGDPDQAQASAQRAYFIEPSADSADTLGWILLRRGQPAQALPLLRQAVLGKSTPEVVYHYAAALSATGDRTQAKALLQNLVSDRPAFDDRRDALRLLDDVSK